jgi:hypothetical protein
VSGMFGDAPAGAQIVAGAVHLLLAAGRSGDQNLPDICDRWIRAAKAQGEEERLAALRGASTALQRVVASKGLDEVLNAQARATHVRLLEETRGVLAAVR